MKPIWSIACLDLLLWCRMPNALVSAFVPPITMTLLLVVLSLAVTKQPVALVIQGHGNFADKISEIIQADNDAYLLTVTDESSAKRMLLNQEVAAVITVPEDFDQCLVPGKKAELKLLLNNVDSDFSDDIRRAVDRSVYQLGLQRSLPPSDEEMRWFNRKVVDEKAETRADEARELAISRRLMLGANPYLIKIDEQDLRQTNVPWLNYQILPVLLLLILNVGLVGTALLSAQDIERKTGEYLLLAPQRPLALVLGRLLGGFLAGMIALVPALALCACTGLIAPAVQHWPALMAIFAATALFAAAAGALIGSLLTGARTIALAASVFATYLFLAGGGFSTIAFLPEGLQIMSTFVPSRYAIDGLRQVLFYPTLQGVATDLLVLCATALVSCVLASVFLRRSWLPSP